MLRSMTGYGRAETALDVGRFVVEIQSVNRKHLDIQLKLPEPLFCFETEVRRLIAKEIRRGYVTARVSVEFSESAPYSVRPNLLLAKGMEEAIKSLSEVFNFSSESINIGQLLAVYPQLLEFVMVEENKEKWQQGLLSSVGGALTHLQMKKKQEGRTLEEDFEKRLDDISQKLERVSDKAPENLAQYREKLKKRLEELLPGSSENEAKILREATLFADKVDIEEEVTRVRHHLKDFKEQLKDNNLVSGKSLEFLNQELFREVNTMAAKANSTTIAEAALAMKNELERIREQLQNVE